MLFNNIITNLVSAIACGGLVCLLWIEIAVAFRSRQELRLLKEAEVRHIQRKYELHKELALANAENEVLLKNYQLLDEHCSELVKDYKSLQKECDYWNQLALDLDASLRLVEEDNETFIIEKVSLSSTS